MNARWSLPKHCALLTMRVVDAIKTDHDAQFPHERQRHPRYHIVVTIVRPRSRSKTQRNAEKVLGQNNAPHEAPTRARQQEQRTSWRDCHINGSNNKVQWVNNPEVHFNTELYWLPSHFHWRLDCLRATPQKPHSPFGLILDSTPHSVTANGREGHT
jgi:hypothetical protein